MVAVVGDSGTAVPVIDVALVLDPALPVAVRVTGKPAPLRGATSSSGLPSADGLVVTTPSSVTSKRWPSPPFTTEFSEPGAHGAGQISSTSVPSAS